MGREEGGGFRMGNTHVQQCLIHVNVWQKSLQYCKEIRLQLKYINFLKNKKQTKNKTGFTIIEALSYNKTVRQEDSAYLFILHGRKIQ